MGQYYTPVIKRGRTLKKVYSHDFGNGLKLTEHSYIGNKFVNVVANEIVDNPAQLYWLGDYAESHDFTSETMYRKIYRYAWPSYSSDRTTVENPNQSFDWDNDWYYINKTKKEYLKMPKLGYGVFTPISLMTAVGNGRGGGDYRTPNNFIGYWAGDIVYLSLKKPRGNYVDITNNVNFGKVE